MRLSTEVFFTTARKRDRQPAEVCPTSVSLEIHELQSVDTPPAIAEGSFPADECAIGNTDAT
jgi:hypothetical protein